MRVDSCFDRRLPDADNDFQAASARLILSSHLRLLGRPLFAADRAAAGRRLYDAPMVVVAHDTAADPVFFYANREAQRLFGMTWAEMVAMPSRYTAEPMLREERQRLLDRVARDGFIADYAGVRIAKSGQRFRIGQAVVWNLLDDAGHLLGQAAAFDRWLPLA